MSRLLSLLLVVSLAVGFGAVRVLFRQRFAPKINFMLVGGYLVLLIAAAAICPFLPKDRLVQNDSSPTVSDMSTSDFLMRFAAGNYGAPNGYNKTEYHLNPLGSGVDITCDKMNGGAVYVGTKGVDVPDNGSGKIDVYCYTSVVVTCGKTTYQRNQNKLAFMSDQTIITLKPKVDGASVRYLNGTLYITGISKTLNYYKVNNSLEMLEDNSFSAGTTSIKQVFVLLPKNMQITGGNYQQYANLPVYMQ